MGGPLSVSKTTGPPRVLRSAPSKASAELISHNKDGSAYDADGNEHLTTGDSADPERSSVKGVQVPAGAIQAYGGKLVSHGFRHTTYKRSADF
ncbi:hypothetical protein AAE478_007590 [Parahypoxylon ruwenzoriense]